MNLYQQLIAQAQDIDIVLAITNIRPNARWNNNALIEADFKDPNNADQIPSVNEIVESWNDIKAQRVAAQSILNNGFDAGSGLILAVGDGDQLAFTKGAAGIALLGLPNETPFEIKDINGVKVSVNVGQFKQIMSGYFTYCAQLWAIR